MANTLTPLIPKAITAVQRVLRERVPLTRMAQADFGSQGAALNEAITIPIVPTVAGTNRTPGVDPVQASDRTATSTTITITKDRTFPFYMTGDDFLRVRENPDFVPASITQAVRAFANEVHSDLAGLHVDAAGYYSASTPSSGAALGTAGTTPFATNKNLINDLAKLLDDSLAPDDDRFLLLDTAARAAASKLSTFVDFSQANTDQTLRQGVIGMVDRFNVVMANDVKRHTPGAATGYLLNGAASAGDTTITVDTGTGAFNAGDIVAIDGTNYVIAAAYAGGAGNITITSGLVDDVADNTAITETAASRRNMAFHREALGLVVRPSANPPMGDSAADATIITDPESGLSFRLAEYRLYGQVQWELQASWGVTVLRPELLKILMG